MKKHRYIIQAALIVALLSMLSAETMQANEPNWPQFRGPGGLGIAPDSQTYPAELDFSRNLLWKTEVPRGHSSPCIWGDNIFVTARSGKSLETICIDRGNGKIKWRRSVEPEKLEKINNSNSHAAPTPVCDGKSVYVYFGSFGLIAYDLEGGEVWNKPLAIPDVYHGSAASPVLANNMVVINCDQFKGAYILAVNRDTGETIWRQERQMDSAGWSTPVLRGHGNEQELVVLGGGHLISYDLKDGRKRWWFDNLPAVYGAALTPVYAEDTFFVAVAVGKSGDPVNPIELPDFKELLEMHDSDKDNRLVQAEIPEDLSLIYRRGPEMTGVKSRFSELDTDQDGAIGEAEWSKVVIDAKDTPPSQTDALLAIRSGGKDDVSQSHEQWRVNEGIGQIASPLFYQGRVYLVKHGGNVTCFDAKTGDKIYGDRAGPRTYYFASPVAADSKIYFCSQNGAVIVVQAEDKFKILAQNKIRERIYATPALVDGKIYLRTDKNMYAFISAKSGSDKTPLTKHEAKEISSAKVESSQAKTLHEAAADGDSESVKSLIAGGADVNATNNWGWTPLYSAAAVGHGDIVNLLIAKGADVNAPSKLGVTPLHFAVNNGDRDIARLLIKNGAGCRTVDKSGVTPLHTTA
ncbi:MAG: outer membrane protein assembly factor BamB family protein, partial [Planctomycetota bacterium]